MAAKKQVGVVLLIAGLLVAAGLVFVIVFNVFDQESQDTSTDTTVQRTDLLSAISKSQEGKCDEAIPMFESLSKQTIDDAYTKAEASLRYGECLFVVGQFQQAATLLSDAQKAFSALGDKARTTTAEQLYNRAVMEAVNKTNAGNR